MDLHCVSYYHYIIDLLSRFPHRRVGGRGGIKTCVPEYINIPINVLGRYSYVYEVTETHAQDAILFNKSGCG